MDVIARSSSPMFIANFRVAPYLKCMTWRNLSVRSGKSKTFAKFVVAQPFPFVAKPSQNARANDVNGSNRHPKFGSDDCGGTIIQDQSAKHGNGFRFEHFLDE